MIFSVNDKVCYVAKKVNVKILTVRNGHLIIILD